MTEATESLELRLPSRLGGPLALSPLRFGIAAVLVSFAYSALRLACDPLMNTDAVYYLVAAEAWQSLQTAPVLLR